MNSIKVEKVKFHVEIDDIIISTSVQRELFTCLCAKQYSDLSNQEEIIITEI